MLHHLKEYAKYTEITGYANIELALADAFLKANRKEPQNVEVQFFDAELIATQKHLYFAVLNALEAFSNGTNISKSIAMETMLYASAKRQIQKAIEQCGIKSHATSLAVVIIGEKSVNIKSALEAITACVGEEPNDKILEMSTMKEKKIKEVFQISDEELQAVTKSQVSSEAVVNLVIERVALLATQL